MLYPSCASTCCKSYSLCSRQLDNQIFITIHQCYPWWKLQQNETKSLLFCSPCIQNAYHFFQNKRIISCLKIEKFSKTCISVSRCHAHLSFYLPNIIHWHHLRYAWNITPLFEHPYKLFVSIQYSTSIPKLQFQLRSDYIQSLAQHCKVLRGCTFYFIFPTGLFLVFIRHGVFRWPFLLKPKRTTPIYSILISWPSHN